MSRLDIPSMLAQSLKMIGEKRFAEVEDSLYWLCGLAPCEAPPFFLLGLAKLGQGDAQRGISYITRALRLDPFNLSFQRQAALIFTEFGLEQQAAACRAAIAGLEGGGVMVVHHPDVRTPIKARLNTTDPGVFRQVFSEKGYDLPFSISPRFIIDAGANVGYASLYLANRFPKANIVAIEPDAGNVAAMKANVKDYPQITTVHAALWPRVCRLRIANPDAGKSSFMVEETDADDGLQATTIQAVFQQSGARAIDILKLDIEGAEKELFEADTSWLDQVRVLIIELHDRDKAGCSRALFSALEDRNTSFFQIAENLVFRLQ